MSVKIIETGLANIASVKAAFKRLGCDAELVTTPDQFGDEDFLVLPGVGAFGPGIERLKALGLAEPLRTRIAFGRPTLAICLGMQMLAQTSDESPGVEGLGVFDVHVGAFPRTVNSPQFGWNQIRPTVSSSALGEGGMVYFANSYRIAEPLDGWDTAWCEYGGSFCAALSKGAVLACQFHPELSGRYGSEMIENWLGQRRVQC